MEERRKVPRHKSLLRGRVYFNNRNSTAECLVRDISAQGARLIFADEVMIPDIVDLYIPHKDQTFRAQVVWRNADESGIAFADHEQMAHPAEANLAERVQKLEHEIDLLKRVIKRLRADTPDRETEAA
jgi:PilZ domain